VQRLKHVADVRVSNVDKKSVEGDLQIRLCNYLDVYNNDRITRALNFMPATATQEQREVFGLKAGDVLLTKDSETPDDIGVSSLVVDDVPDLICGYHLAVVRARPDRAFGGYLRWVLASLVARQQMTAGSTGVTRFGLRVETISDLRVPLPPLPIQRVISEYLDRETARIDALIAAKRRMLGLLQERRVATIAHMVTPNSGVTNWSRSRLRHVLLRMIDTEHRTAPFYEDGQCLVIRTNNVSGGRLVVGPGSKFTDSAGYEEWTRRGRPEPGDILFTREAPAGEACIFPIGVKACVGQRTVLFKVDRARILARYCLWALYGGIARSFIDELSQGSTLPHLNMSDISDIPMWVPDTETQRVIADRLDVATAGIDRALAHIGRQMELSAERRQAVITAAVRGQLDVSEAA
jgi:type I restriction enzyme, S subunit